MSEIRGRQRSGEHRAAGWSIGGGEVAATPRSSPLRWLRSMNSGVRRSWAMALTKSRPSFVACPSAITPTASTKALVASAHRREAAGMDGDQLARIRLCADIQTNEPFDPLEAAAVGGDEAERRAVSVRERLIADGGGEQGGAGFGQWQRPAVAGDGDKADPGGGGVRNGRVEDAANGDATPALGAVEAACAVEGGVQRIACGGDIVEREGKRVSDGAAYGEAPGGRIERMWVVGDPARGRENVAGVAVGLVGAGEAAPRAG